MSESIVSIDMRRQDNWAWVWKTLAFDVYWQSMNKLDPAADIRDGIRYFLREDSICGQSYGLG